MNKNWVVVSNIFYFHPYLGKIPILTNFFQRGWFNHQLEKVLEEFMTTSPFHPGCRPETLSGMVNLRHPLEGWW